MKLIFLYGPPAVGKLTVALALSPLTGYKVFHNHLTIDLVSSVFEWGTPLFWNFVNRYRLELIEAAAKSNVPGLIFTFVYAFRAMIDSCGKWSRRSDDTGGKSALCSSCARDGNSSSASKPHLERDSTR